MNRLAATGLCCILAGGFAGCGTPSFSDGAGGAFPVAITQLTPSIDSAAGSVDLSLTIKNNSGVAIRSVEVVVVPFGVDGQRISAPGGTLTMNGPYASGASAGPQNFPAVWQSTDARCLEVHQIKVTMLDYSSASVVGKAANAMVASDSRRQCQLAGD